MLSGLNGSDLLLLFLGVCVRNLSNDSCLPSFEILNVVYNPLSSTKSQKRLASNSDPPPCSEVQEVQDDTVVQLPHVVCATLQNQKFMDQLLPMISQKVIESIKPTLKKNGR
jgi:hypothetical protein